MAQFDCDVLVAGAGPTGLMAAGRLAACGAAVRLIDRLDGPSPWSRALGVHARSLELFAGQDLADPAMQAGRIVTGIGVAVNGREAGRIAIGAVGVPGLDTPYPYVLVLSQAENETLLRDHAAKLGVSVAWRTELLSFAQDGDGVTARLRDGEGRETTIRARYLVGADGARSTVRHILGLPFEGATYEQRFVLLDATAERWPLPPGEMGLLFSDDGFVAAFPLAGDNGYRLVSVVPPGLPERDDYSVDEMSQIFERVGRFSFGLRDPVWRSVYRLHHRAVPRFRVGRVFLAGDAAHIHSPAGGQGMNTGLQDAANLAWKLAAVLRGRGGERLLDSYEAERLPVARSVLRTTDRLFTTIAATGPLARLFKNHVAARAVAFASRTTRVREAIFRRLSQTAISYRGSSAGMDSDASGALRGGPRAGDRAPHAEFETVQGERGLFDLVRPDRPIGLLFGAAEPEPLLAALSALAKDAGWGELQLVAVRRDGRSSERCWIDVTGAAHRRYGAEQGAALFVIRPDGYIGLRAAPAEPAILAAYLARLKA